MLRGPVHLEAYAGGHQTLFVIRRLETTQKQPERILSPDNCLLSACSEPVTVHALGT